MPPDEVDHLAVIEEGIAERREQLVRHVSTLDALNQLRHELIAHRDRTGEPPTIDRLAAEAESKGEIARAEWRDLMRRASTEEEGDPS
ncbi:MAG: hypothetical protein ACR2I5_05775 [Candidatus Limnocylindria bacterium]